MIDLHSHILPGVDDGSSDMDMSIEMARLAVADGTRILACTPHITPGVYQNSTQEILLAMNKLQLRLDELEIYLRLVAGADIHVSDEMATRLQEKTAPTLANSRYFLFEPPHHIMPPRLLEFAKKLLATGYVPVITHPERLTWIEKNFEVVCAMREAGALIQITAGSVDGGFGRRAKYWSERMLDENRVDIIASDAHHPTRRPPGLSRARDLAAKRAGENHANDMVYGTPALILRDQAILRERESGFASKKPKKSDFLSKLGLRKLGKP